MKDMKNLSAVGQLLASQTITDTTATKYVDCAGAEALNIIVDAGAGTSTGIYTLKLQESDTTADSAFTDVAAADQLGTLTVLKHVSGYENFVQQVGYIGAKRYVRLVATKDSNANSQLLSVTAQVGFPHTVPASAPTVGTAV